MNFKPAICAAVLGLVAVSGPLAANNLFSELNFLTQNHPLLSSAKAQKDASDQRLLASRGGKTPVVSVRAQAGYEHQSRPNTPHSSEDTESASVSVTQLLWDGGVVGGAVKAAKSRVKAADATVASTEQDLIQAGIKTYFGLSLAKQRLEHAKESVARIAEQKDAEAKKMDRGKGSKADFLQAESQLLAAQSRVATEEGAVQIAKNAYLQVFGKSAPALMTNTASPSTPLPLDLVSAEAAALDNSPSLLAARAAQSAATSDFKSAEGSYMPRFDAVLEGDYKSDAQAVLGEVGEGRAFVRMTYDFDLGISRRGVVGAARAVQQSSVYETANRERTVLESVRSAWQRHMTAKQNYDISLKQLESATEFLELAIKERELGKRTLQDILNGELVRLSAKTRLVGAEAEVATSAFDILHATGQLNLGAL